MYPIKQIHLNHNYCKLEVGANLFSLLLKIMNNTREVIIHKYETIDVTECRSTNTIHKRKAFDITGTQMEGIADRDAC